MNAIGAKAIFDAAMEHFSPRILASRGWVVHSCEFPTLDLSFREPVRQELRLRLTFDDWNDSPPSVDLLMPDGSFWTNLPPMNAGANIFNTSGHPRTGRPFVCMAGTREYHEHPSHLNDLWSSYKASDGYKLGNIVERLWNGWRRFWP